MTTVKKKKMIKVDVFTGNLERIYYGRLLGLVDDEEFNAIIKSDTLKKRIHTKETMPLEEITDNWQDLNGLRLVMTIKKIDDGKDTIEPRLFISERLSFVSYAKPEGNCAFTGESQSYLMVEEEEV